MCSSDLEEAPKPATSAPTSRTKKVIATFVMGMTLSPCLDLLSIYVMASQLAWHLLLLLSLIMALTTLTTMLLLVWLSFHGLQRVRLAWLDRNEGLVMGAILLLLGVLLLFL